MTTLAGENTVSVDNFWDVKKYKRVVQRIDDGVVLLDDLSRMVAERASIEKKYALNLKNWSKRWDKQLEKGPEYREGSLRTAWKSMFVEADRVSALHLEVESRLLGEIQYEISTWKKDHYQKSMMSWKVTKKADLGFERAQRPWAKLKAKADRSKKRYHGFCQSVDSLSTKIKQGEVDGQVSAEEIQKLKDKLAKAEGEAARTKEKYSTRLQLLDEDRPRYEQEMTYEFEHCQDAEQKRIDFFKRVMRGYQQIVDIDYTNIYPTLLQSLDTINSDADLVKYSDRYGVGMPLCVPTFVEWGEVEVPPKPVNKQLSLSVPDPGYGSQSSSSNTDEVEYEDSDEEWEEVAERVPPPPRGATGVPVRALYDYVAEEPEEMSFSVGDVITQTEDEDEQGWCKGIHSNGTVGLYPANYVEPIE